MSESPERASSQRFLARLRSGFPQPVIIAHRGDSAHAPENTLDAAKQGWQVGADAWEFDVQLSRDGVPVVVHDESLRRTTDVARRYAGDLRATSGFLVSDFDFDEIRALDAGSWFVESDGGPRSARSFGTLAGLDPESRSRFQSGEIRVPSLREALDLTARLDWLANVELKSFPNANPSLLVAALAVIAETKTADRVLVSSFDHADVARAARLDREFATGVLVSSPLHNSASYVRDSVRAETYHPSALVLGAGSDEYRRHPSAASLRVGDLDALNHANVPVLVFTVNDATRHGLATHLVEAGARGLFTDDPRGLRDLFDHQTNLS